MPATMRACSALAVVASASIAATVIAGCDRRGGAGTGSETVCDLKNVRVVHWLDSGRLVWDVDVSPDGDRFAVRRNVSERVNVYRYRVDVDGQPGPRPFDSLGVTLWSRDGRTLVYVGNEHLPQPGREFVVVEGKVHGPYPRVRDLSLTADGRRWAFVQEDTSSGDMKKTLVVNGGQTPLTFLFGEMRLDASGEPAFRIEEHKWKDLAGRGVPEPPRPDETLQKIPTAAVKRTLLPGKHGEPKRQKLTVNGKDIGTFDQVLGRGRGNQWQAGYQQPDGRVLVYAINGGKLMRLRLKP